MTRRKRVPPGTRINPLTPSAEELGAALQFAADFNICKDELDKGRAQCEVEGLDPFEMLARVVAHNWAVKQGTLRLKEKGVATRKARAEERAKEIRQQLREAAESVKAVEIDRLGKPASSERTIRRVKARKAP
jgi:hypothetical protein